MIGSCGASGCIDAATISALIAAWFACWAFGYCMAKSVAWVRKIGDVI